MGFLLVYLRVTLLELIRLIIDDGVIMRRLGRILARSDIVNSRSRLDFSKRIIDRIDQFVALFTCYDREQISHPIAQKVGLVTETMSTTMHMSE